MERPHGLAHIGASGNRLPSRCRLTGCVAVVICVGGLALDASAASAGPAAHAQCPALVPDVARSRVLEKAGRSGRDLLGEQLVRRPGGASLRGVRALVPPLFFARGRGGARLTRSGAYYLAFSLPWAVYGERGFALHAADGSEITARRAGGESLRVLVGPGAGEPFGSCLARLERPSLARGFLPVLQTRYVDARGVRYRQESFAGRVRGVGSLVSFVRLDVDARAAPDHSAVVRFVSTDPWRLTATAGGVASRGSAAFHINGQATIVADWLHRKARGGLVPDLAAYESARNVTVRFWLNQLEGQTRFVVPERAVEDALRNLLIQQIGFTWRYSIGNNYEELSFAEALDNAQVLSAYGYSDVSRAIIRLALHRLGTRYTNWRAGAVMLAVATQATLNNDTDLLAEATPLTLRDRRSPAPQTGPRPLQRPVAARAVFERHLYQGPRPSRPGGRLGGTIRNRTRLGHRSPRPCSSRR